VTTVNEDIELTVTTPDQPGIFAGSLGPWPPGVNVKACTLTPRPNRPLHLVTSDAKKAETACGPWLQGQVEKGHHRSRHRPHRRRRRVGASRERGRDIRYSTVVLGRGQDPDHLQNQQQRKLSIP